MIATLDIDQIIGAEAVDPLSDRIGRVSQIYVDTDTEQPTWASVRTGLFGLSESLVPLGNGTWDHEQLHVTVEKAQVKDAPRVDPDAEISPEEQDRLYSYYGLSGSTRAETDQSGTSGGEQSDLGRSSVGMAGMQDLSGSDADLRTDVMPGREVDPAAEGTSRSATDAGRVDGYVAATLSDTGYGAGAGLAGAGVGRAPHPDDDGIAGMGSTGGQSAEADALRERVDDRSYEREDIRDAPMPGTAGAAGASQGDPAMQTESGALRLPPETEEVGAGMQRQPGGWMRLRRYIVRQETVAAPIDQQDEPGRLESEDPFPPFP